MVPPLVRFGLLARISSRDRDRLQLGVWRDPSVGRVSLVLDAGTLAILAVHKGGVPVPDSLRYAIAAAAAVLAGIGVHAAIRVPPVKDIEIHIAGLDPAFDGYTMLQLTDLHISRLFPRRWAKAVVDRSNALRPT